MKIPFNHKEFERKGYKNLKFTLLYAAMGENSKANSEIRVVKRHIDNSIFSIGEIVRKMSNKRAAAITGFYIRESGKMRVIYGTENASLDKIERV